MRVLKKLCTVLMSALLCLGMCGLVACGGGNNEGEVEATNYTVIVKDVNGNALQGIRIGLCSYNEETDTKGACGQLQTTDANGKVVFENEDVITSSGLFNFNLGSFGFPGFNPFGE